MDYGIPFLLETPTPEDACAMCARLGFRFVELNASFPACQPGRLQLHDLKALEKRYGLYFTLHAHEEMDPFSDSSDVRAAWLRVLEQTLALAAAMDMPVVNMHLPRGVYVTLPEKRVYIHEAYADEYMRCAEALLYVCEKHLSGTRTMLCIENTSGFLPHEQRLLELLLSSPVIGLTLDLGHCHAADNRDFPFYQQHLHKLRHMHGHDGRGKQDHLPLGEGEIDLESRFLLAKGCGARVVLETKTVSALQISRDWLYRHPHLL